VVRPRIPIAPGENQFWRIVNALPDLYVDIMVDREELTVVAIKRCRSPFTIQTEDREVSAHPVSTGGRVEEIVTGPPAEARSSLRTLCVDTGADSDPNPSMVLADLDEPRPRRYRYRRRPFIISLRPKLCTSRCLTT
jgi:suppressor of ftsI